MVLLGLVGVATLAACQVPASGIIAIIVGGLVTAGGGTLLLSQGCAHRGPVHPCLSIAPIPPKKQDAGVKPDSAAKGPKPNMHPCLSVLVPKKTPMRVCLSADPIEGELKPKPKLHPCLSMPPPKSSKPGAAVETPTALDDRAALLARHGSALPEDVARRLTQQASSEEKSS